MGLSRDTFYRYKKAMEEAGVEALLHKDRRKPNPKNRLDDRTEEAVLAYSLDFAAHGQVLCLRLIQRRPRHLAAAQACLLQG